MIRLNPIGRRAGGRGSSLVIDITINSSQQLTRSRPGKTGEILLVRTFPVNSNLEIKDYLQECIECID